MYQKKNWLENKSSAWWQKSKQNIINFKAIKVLCHQSSIFKTFFFIPDKKKTDKNKMVNAPSPKALLLVQPAGNNLEN